MKILYRTLFVLFFISSVHAIEVEGDVEGEWTMDDSPVIVIDDITLRRNDELVIQPGVEVFFDRYKFFMVYGRLTAAGNEDDSIRFDWHNANSKWRSVRLIDADEESIITYCVFLHSERTGHYQNPESRGGALYLEETSIEVSHCRFSFNHTTGQGGGFLLTVVLRTSYTTNSPAIQPVLTALPSALSVPMHILHITA